MEPITDSAETIVRNSGSNLAFALAVLPPDRRRDMRIFYAFCRVVDDLADDPGISSEDRRAGLSRWRRLSRGEESDPLPGVESEWLELCESRELNQDDVEAIIDGVEMDLNPQPFETAEDLKRYCFHVASAVGLVSIDLFGCQDPGSRVYAEQLGYALQWTNIMRDVGEDAKEGRIFLPREDLAHYSLTEESILSRRPDPVCFRQLMLREAERAWHFYDEAIAALPEVDRRALRSAELMRRIYSGILRRMEEGDFQVFDHRYRLSKTRMLGEFLRAKWFG
ncbi:MAG: phytoene/squalene synthase family protein [Verrucomicrobiota bacterium]